MSSRDLDRQLESWFESAGADHVPQGLLDDVFSVTRTSGQRHGAMGRLVTAASDWWRAPAILRIVPQQAFYLVLVALLVVAAAIAIATAGAHRTAPPFGIAANGYIAFDRDGVIVVARADGTEISEVTVIPEARGPVYAPDGSRFAFYGTVDSAVSILVATADGRDPIAISAGIAIDDLAMETPVSWSPDSQSIVFGGLDGERRRRLFVASVDGSAAHAVGDTGLSGIDPAWSPDGAWIAFHGFRPAEDATAGQYRTSAGLYLVRPDGQGQTLLVEGDGGDFIYRKPQWLPDPDRSVLAYAVGEPGSYDIAVFDVHSMRQTVISHGVEADLWPVWAPDGSALAWSSSDARINIARPDGTLVRTLPPDIDYESLWSPDGRYLLGWTNESRSAMAVMSSDGSSATTFIPMDGRSRSHWSWQRRAP